MIRAGRSHMTSQRELALTTVHLDSRVSPFGPIGWQGISFRNASPWCVDSMNGDRFLKAVASIMRAASMSFVLRRIAFTTACAFVVSGSSVVRTGFAAPSEQVPVGPRAVAMGGAFSSIADDATALFWNPAGLPLIGHEEVTGSHA